MIQQIMLYRKNNDNLSIFVKVTLKLIVLRVSKGLSPVIGDSRS